MPTESENHLRQPDDLSTFPWQRFLALRPHLAVGVLLSSDAGPSFVPLGQGDLHAMENFNRHCVDSARLKLFRTIAR